MLYTISAQVESELIIKKSRFQGFAVPFTASDDLKPLLNQYRQLTANHQCWAYKVETSVRFSDAGEPSGTAGRAILTAIEGQNLTNVVVIINRWFGGIKLGTGGLMRAYAQTAGQTLKLAHKAEILCYQSARFKCQFKDWAQLKHYLEQHKIRYHENFYVSEVAVDVQVLTSQINSLNRFLQNLTRGQELINI